MIIIFKIIDPEGPITGWLFYRVFPTPTLPQAASANTSSLAFIDFAWITSIAYRVVHSSTHRQSIPWPAHHKNTNLLQDKR
jgi:hypothetical protein